MRSFPALAPTRAKSLLLLVLILFSSCLALAAPSEKEVAGGRYWKLLLHYREGILGGERSEADGPDFFLSSDGRADPYGELLADIKAFVPQNTQVVGPFKQHPQCAFPERFRFLNETLHLNIPRVDCPKFKEWRAHFQPQSVTMIFAASYLGSPASMFGHTFLRVDSAPPPGETIKNDLLDYAISFEAVTGGNGFSFGYALKGLFGFFPGYFSLSPFHIKINLYTNMESRDLWEYKLSLKPNQIDRMLNHAWEMANTYFNYYFFNKNCSYHILSLLEVAEPSWHLRDKFRPMTIPSDSVRALADTPGAVVNINYRPAVLHTLQQRVRYMSADEKALFFHEMDDPAHLKGGESPLVLDALIDWQKFHVAGESKSLYDKDKQIERSLLVARASARGDEPSVTEGDREAISPDQGHLSSKISLYSGVEQAYGFSGFEFRPAIHDFFDSDKGYLPHSDLIIGRTALEYTYAPNSPQNIRLQDFTVAEAGTLSPWDPFHREPAWQVGGGLFRPIDTGCLSCIGIRVRGGGGFSTYLFPQSQNALLFGLLNGNLEGAGVFQMGYRAGVSAEVGLSFDLGWESRLQVEGEHFRYAPYTDDMSQGLTDVGGTFSLSTIHNLEFRLKADWLFKNVSTVSRALLSVGHYY